MKHINTKVIGLTGGIATGKSTVSGILKENGEIVIDADQIARDVVDPNMPAYEEIKEHFGENVLLYDGKLNRKKLGEIVFSDTEELNKLNEITHPYIFKRIKEEIEEYIKLGKKNIFVDIPLLIEELDDMKKDEIFFDEIWLVYLDKERQIERLIKRDNLSREDSIKRIQSQLDIEDKVEKSDFIIDNRISIEELEKIVLDKIQEINS